MKKITKIALMAIVGLFALVPMINVHAAEGVVEVSTAEELYAALEGSEAKEVVLLNDIETTHKINVTSEKIIDGNGHTIKYVGTFADGSTNNTVWGSQEAYPYNGGVYVIQVYRTTATIKNITLTGGNAGLSANGAKVTLQGNINVSGNGFGGIEMTTKDNAFLPYIYAGEATIINTTETTTTPTVWTDEIDQTYLEDGTVDIEATEDTFEGGAFFLDNGQLKLYMDKEQLPEASDTVKVVDLTEETPTEEPTTPVEENPTQEKVEDTTENPETSDGILLFVSLAVIGLAGTALTYRRLHN